MKTLFAILVLAVLTISCESQPYKAGSKVEIKWSDGIWYPATIIEVSDIQYKIHLTGDGDSNLRDQWISKDKDILRPAKDNQGTANSSGPSATSTASKQQNPGSAKGKRVEVNDRAFWYKATVLEQKGDLYKVHFDGYESSDDKWVHKSYTRDLNENDESVTVTCSFTPPPGEFTDSSPASDALFKREIYDWYARLVNGSLTRPIRIGIVFTLFSRDEAYKNTVMNMPGRGATRRHEGAPVNATIYPVKTTFFICEDYNGSVTQKQVNSDFSFYISKDGEWTCSKDN